MTVLIDHTISRKGSEILKNEIKDRVGIEIEIADGYDDFLEILPETKVLLTFGFDTENFDKAAELEWIQALSAGVDSYDLERLESSGVRLTNASGVHSQPIAEQVLGYMLMFERELGRAVRQQEKGVWERFRGGELKGKTVGIIGVGEIGGRVAEVCSALGTEVIGTKRDTSEYNDSVDKIYPHDEVSEVIKRSDYLVLACPLNEETRGMISKREFVSMKSSAVLVNIARGGVVDEKELEEALQQRRIKGAALDVFEEEPLDEDSVLWDLSNVVITPHMAGSTPKYWERCAEIFSHNYEVYSENKGEYRNLILGNSG